MSDLIRRETAPLVYTRARWADAWTYRPLLFCERVEYGLGQIGAAQFVWHYGAKSVPPGNQFQEVDPLQLKDHWVKVVISATDDTAEMIWYGVIQVSTLDINGGTAAFLSGDQRFTAYSFEYLLSKIQLTESHLDNGDWLASPIAFNAFKSDRGRSRVQYANKSPDSARFATDLKEAVAWTARDILQYLVSYYINFANDFLPSHLIAPALNFRFPDDMNFLPGEVHVGGKTILDLLNSLFTPTRGLSWKITPFDPPEEVYLIDIISTSDQTVSLPQGGKIVANTNIISISAYDARDLERCELTEDFSRRVDRVIVEGGEIGSVFTVADRDGTLLFDWNSEDENAYRLGVSLEAGYIAMDLSEQKTRNDHVRMDDQLRHVFTRFRFWDVAGGWDGLVGNGEGTAGLNTEAFPWPTDQMAIDDIDDRQLPLWQSGMTLMPYLPLRTRVDYSQPEIAVDNNPDTSLADFRRPLAVAQRDGLPGNRWIDLEAGYTVAGHDEILNYELSAQVVVHDHQLGFSVVPNTVSHALANYYQFDGLPGNPATSHLVRGAISWENIAVTVYARCHNHVRITWPEQPPEPTTDLNSILVLRLGDAARLDYLIMGTIVDVHNFSVKRVPSTTTIRDDREVMKDLAMRAWQYYKKPRVGLGLFYRAIWDLPEVGQMIDYIVIGRPTHVRSQSQGTIVFSTGTTTSIRMVTAAGVGMCLGTKPWIAAQRATIAGATKKFLVANAAVKQVNTIVSRVVYDFTEMTTQVSTSFAELDFEGVFANASAN